MLRPPGRLVAPRAPLPCTRAGTVAQSGTSSFIEAFSEGADVNLIGQFGVGFYSVYLVADSVAVHSKSNDDEKQARDRPPARARLARWRLRPWFSRARCRLRSSPTAPPRASQWVWTSSADSTFSVHEDVDGEDLGRGSKIVLTLKEDCLEFLEEERLKGLIKRYSEFINFPIYLYTTKEEEEEVPIEEGDSDESEEEEEEEEEEDGEEDDGEIEDADDEEDDAPKTKKVKKTVNEWELVNDAKALWTRNPSDITDDEYKSFYQSLTKDFGEPLTHTHRT